MTGRVEHQESVDLRDLPKHVSQDRSEIGVERLPLGGLRLQISKILQGMVDDAYGLCRVMFKGAGQILAVLDRALHDANPLAADVARHQAGYQDNNRAAKGEQAGPHPDPDLQDSQQESSNGF
ncbi:MAG: hypothetical protein ACREEE_13550 [Dongiaceae bacterium]